MIEFKEHTISGYKARTIENAKADLTIAIATDFGTAGERCTFNAVKMQRKMYSGIPYNSELESSLISTISIIGKNRDYTLNVAGNGIYTLKREQKSVDAYIDMLLGIIFTMSSTPTLIRSGGQTGVDEAALKAAVRMKIPALCLAPKGWVFRDINGNDIADEQQFKARFFYDKA